MRSFVILLAGVAAGASGVASAQTAKNTPEGIICAMTGSCDTAAVQGARVPVGDEKAFSLARSSAPAAKTPSSTHAVAPAPSQRAHGGMRVAHRQAIPATIRPGGGIDMQVTFRSGSAEMTPQAQTEARAFATAMASPQMAGMRFAIEGHTDAIGTRDKNMLLSQARAKSVMDYLVSQGIDAGRLSAKGYGPDRPVRGAKTTAPINRRVEFVKAT